MSQFKYRNGRVETNVNASRISSGGKEAVLNVQASQLLLRNPRGELERNVPPNLLVGIPSDPSRGVPQQTGNRYVRFGHEPPHEAFQLEQVLVACAGQFFAHEDRQPDQILDVVPAGTLAFGNLARRLDQRFLPDPEVVLWRGDVDERREGLPTDAGPFAGLARVEPDVVGLVTAEGALPLLEVVQGQLTRHLERAAPRDALEKKKMGDVS